MKVRLIILIAILFGYNHALAAVFTVTSNANSGVGTLRDAITLSNANGIIEKDYIYFSLPNTLQDRIISLETALPYLSSNLVIDGTSQPGSAFGVSDAKIIIQPKNGSQIFHVFVLINTDGFEIYGCYIRDFVGFVFHNPNSSTLCTVLYVEQAKNIQVGAPGKGNVFVNNGYSMNTSYVSIVDKTSLPASGVNTLKVYGNIFGLEPDGKTTRGTPGSLAGTFDLNYCMGDIEFGGPEIIKRNVFANGLGYISGYFTGKDRLFNANFLIQNNYFSYDVGGNPIRLVSANTSNLYAIFFEISRWVSDQSSYPYSFKILDNKIQAPHTITVGVVSGQIIFQGNVIMQENVPGQPSYASGGVGLSSRSNVKVGGLNPGEANIIYGGQLRAASPSSILVQRNSIYCVNLRDLEDVYLPISTNLPTVNITRITANNVIGTASPGAQIELFWDDDCIRCQPLTYFATVVADASGNWKYDGVINKGILATATLNGFTSPYTKTMQATYGNILQSTCGKSNGAILGNKFVNAGGYRWTNSNNDIIGEDADISNLSIGKYKLAILNGTCVENFEFEIKDYSPKITDFNLRKSIPNCGESNGFINGLNIGNFPENTYKYKWVDASGKTVGTNLNLNNVSAGVYTLEMSYNGCSAFYGPVSLISNDLLTIDQSNIQIIGSSCTSSTGSITNIKTKGSNLIYKWKNANGLVVGNSIDLLNMPKGNYTLEVSDGTVCGTLTLANIVIPELNSISIDESLIEIVNQNCKHLGKISGIKVNGASKYVWKNQNGVTVGSTIELNNMAAGFYTLELSNEFGCIETSKRYEIKKEIPTQFIIQVTEIKPTCNTANGSLTVIATGNQPKNIRWVNQAGNNVGTTAKVIGLPAGKYQLYLGDDLDCENFYNDYELFDEAVANIDRSVEKVVNDQCNQSLGKIIAPQLNGGKLPYFYEWTNTAGDVLGNTAILSNLNAGVYKLQIGDALSCSRQTITYNVNNEISSMEIPKIEDVWLCAAGDALIKVVNFQNGNYFLYNDAGKLLMQNNMGVFSLNVKDNGVYQISRKVGDCESLKVSFSINIGNDAVKKSNTITPNGDGINDVWELKGIQNYPKSSINIYNRNGAIIYSSIGYSKPFDGTHNSALLPAGTYYYVIDLKSSCGLMNGVLNIIY